MEVKKVMLIAKGHGGMNISGNVFELNDMGEKVRRPQTNKYEYSVGEELIELFAKLKRPYLMLERQWSDRYIKFLEGKDPLTEKIKGTTEKEDTADYVELSNIWDDTWITGVEKKGMDVCIHAECRNYNVFYNHSSLVIGENNEFELMREVTDLIDEKIFPLVDSLNSNFNYSEKAVLASQRILTKNPDLTMEEAKDSLVKKGVIEVKSKDDMIDLTGSKEEISKEIPDSLKEPEPEPQHEPELVETSETSGTETKSTEKKDPNEW